MGDNGIKMTDLAVRGVSGGSISDVVEPTGGDASDGITRYVQGPWGLSVEASAEAQGPVPQPGSVAVLAWVVYTRCIGQPDPGLHPAWAGCKARMARPSSEAGPAQAGCRECMQSPADTVCSVD